MTRKDLADYIRDHKDGNSLHYSYDDQSVLAQHTRTVLHEHLHITEEHIIECCMKASTYEEFIELCRPIAKADTEGWLREWNKPPPKGRTRRRFR
jgi:hypothetical protein